MSTYRLTFTLPRTVSLLAQPGRHQPCVAGVVLMVERCGLVTIEGPSRESLFEQARRFMRVINKGRPPLEIQAWVQGPPRTRPAYAGSEEQPLLYPAPRDLWKIIVDAEVAITPASSLPSTLFARDPDQQQTERAG
jgi:hypothetical protein